MITFRMKEAGALLSLLAFELFEKKMDADWDGVDWRLFLQAATEHAVCPLLYAGVNAVSGVPAGVFDIVERFAVRSTILSDRMAKVQSEILDEMAKGNVKTAVLKGTSVAAFYRHPEVRMTGDIDILVRESDMKTCGGILLSMGFEKTHETEMHDCYKKKGVSVEVHRAVSRFPATEKGQYALRFMKCALDSTDSHAMGGYVFPMLGKPHHMVALLSHMERHMGASGIGLRQMCDWAVAVNNVKPEETDEIVRELKNCGLYVFACALTGVAEKFLGLPECAWMERVSEELIDETMEEILSAGNFQAQYKNRPKASAFIDPYDLDGDGKRRIIRTYLRKVKRKTAAEFPWAKSRAWIPVFGVYYAVWLAVSVLRGKIDGKGMMNTLKTSKKREKYLRKLCLYK